VVLPDSLPQSPHFGDEILSWHAGQLVVDQGALRARRVTPARSRTCASAAQRRARW
jgi:hypothetical protein